MKEQGVNPTLPPCRCIYLVRTLFEVGPDTSGNPLAHSEIRFWQENTGVDLNAWEAETLRRASVAYLKQAQVSSALACDPPYQTEQSRREIAKARTEQTRRNLRELARQETK